MEISPFTIYLITQLDSLKTTVSAITFFAIVISFTLGLNCIFGPLSETANCFKVFKKASIITVILILITTIIPSSKSMIAIYTIPEIVNNPSIQQLPKDIIDFIQNALNQPK